MKTGLSLSEEFKVLFTNLKNAAKDEPKRVVSFYAESEAIRNALDALHEFLARTDLERRVFCGQKLIIPRATGFEAAWNEYYSNWRFRIESATHYPKGYRVPELTELILSADDIPESEGYAYPDGREAYKRKLEEKLFHAPRAFDDGLGRVGNRSQNHPRN